MNSICFQILLVKIQIISCFQIKLANETAAQAARDISDAMAQLSQVSTRRTEVEKRLSPQFQTELQNNSAILDEIKKCSEDIKELLKSANTLGSNTTSTVTEAEGIIKNANATVHQRKVEAENALTEANNALSSANKSRENAVNSRNMAAQFKVHIFFPVHFFFHPALFYFNISFLFIFPSFSFFHFNFSMIIKVNNIHSFSGQRVRCTGRLSSSSEKRY